jgi:hypothetical protein
MAPRKGAEMEILTLGLALALALIHLFSGHLHVLHRRSQWLSAAAGVVVAYVFLHILPHLHGHHRIVAEQLGLAPDLAEITVFALMLAGLVAFYGLERLATLSRQKAQGKGKDDQASPRAFRIHITSFALYNLLIGHLLVDQEVQGLWPLLAFFVAMAAHFAVNDDSLRQHHKRRYDGSGRWLVALAVLAGWLLGRAALLPDVVVALFYAVLAGGVVLNVLKEELPAESQGRFLPLLAGAAGYSALLVGIRLL